MPFLSGVSLFVVERCDSVSVSEWVTHVAVTWSARVCVRVGGVSTVDSYSLTSYSYYLLADYVTSGCALFCEGA